MISASAKAFIKTLVFTILLPGSATVVVPYLLLGPGPKFEIGLLRFLGVVPIVFGAAAYFWCAWDFVFVGKGTPAPIDPPKELVVKGPYRFVRNPMYVAVVSVLFGEAILFRSYRLLAYAFVGWVACHLFVVFYEERTLRKKFGAAYEKYCKAVLRWLPRSSRGKSTP